MPDTSVPDPVGDTLVELLFRGTNALSIRDVLVVGSSIESVQAAIERYSNDQIGDGPTVTTVGQELTHTSVGSPSLDAEGMFLSERFNPDMSFDFVVGVSPRLNWSSLTDERRREIASLSPNVSPTDEWVNPGALYLDQSSHVLGQDGRAVIMTRRPFKTAEGVSEFRASLAPNVRDVEQLSPADYSELSEARIAVAIEASETEAYSVDDRASWADLSAVERRLARAAARRNPQITAAGIATQIENMDVYDADADASFVYFDLHYEDYDGSLIYDDAEERHGLVGYVSRAELNVESGKPVRQHTRDLSEDRCLDSDAAIDDVIQLLRDHRFAFLGRPTEPDGIVTRYDLNRIPVYHWLYDEFSRFEIGLRNILRQASVDESDHSGKIPGHGVGDLVPDRFANGQLSHLVSILQAEGLTQRVLPTEGVDTEASLEDLVVLRNAVAHYNPIIHTMTDRRTTGDPVRGAIQLEDEVTLLEAIIENLE